MLFWLSHMSLLISVVLVAVVPFSLLFILSREISTPPFSVYGFIAVHIIITITIDGAASFFIRNVLRMVTDLLARRISGTVVDFLGCYGKFYEMTLTFSSSQRNCISLCNELIGSFKLSINN